MDTTALKETIKKELPELLRDDPSLSDYILRLTREVYADKDETQKSVSEILDEMRRDREENARKWDEQNRKWHEYNRQLDKQSKKWDEQDRKWDENQKVIVALSKKIDRSIGALGARWGLRSEKAFRDALAGILEENFGVEVINITEFDDAGEVFGKPDQIELDIIIKNDLLIICELKSSMSKSDIYTFERKARFYEKRHQRKADKLIVISPMIDARAEKIARKMNIVTYGDSIEVEQL
ncbi:PD-(D/E)XK nuclease family protein [Desulfonatronovibrio magnus]|uniref:PD-(D/E)XK nuclease family protein n=1 Tax=Desulfonatronovibrio magnus TaxID=698827 RepID=UPI0005EB46FF|nr:DUF3782 domain-containing protein [Desulfonatronovibrio magnus]